MTTPSTGDARAEEAVARAINSVGAWGFAFKGPYSDQGCEQARLHDEELRMSQARAAIEAYRKVIDEHERELQEAFAKAERATRETI